MSHGCAMAAESLHGSHAGELPSETTPRHLPKYPKSRGKNPAPMTASSGSIGSRYRMLAWVARCAAITNATGRTNGSSRCQLRKLKTSERNAHTKIGRVKTEMIHFCQTGVTGAGHGVKNLRKRSAAPR